MNGQRNLFEIIPALNPSCGLTRVLDSRQQEGHQNSYYRNHDQQFNQSERRAAAVQAMIHAAILAALGPCFQLPVVRFLNLTAMMREFFAEAVIDQGSNRRASTVPAPGDCCPGLKTTHRSSATDQSAWHVTEVRVFLQGTDRFSLSSGSKMIPHAHAWSAMGVAGWAAGLQSPVLSRRMHFHVQSPSAEPQRFHRH